MIDYQTERFFQGLRDSQLSVIESLLDVVIEEDESERDPMQIREVLPVEEWINYKHFLGPFSRDLYPYWKSKAPGYLNSGTPELILSGSVGGGKTTFALCMQAYKLYVLSCYKFPQRLFGLSDITDIFFAYLSINFTHAERTGYGQFRSMIDSIPYFQKEFSRDTHINSVLRFPGRINIIPGTDNLSVVSTNLFGCMMDEADFYRKGVSGAGDASKASNIYREVTDRRTSRFMVKGFDNGFSAIISSASFQSTFVQQRIRKALKDGSGHVIITKLWDANPEKYTKKRIWIFKGTEKDDAYVVDTPDDIVPNAAPEIKKSVESLALFSDNTGDDLICEIMKKLPERFRNNFVEVPREFRKNFEDDVYGALRNIAGEAVSPAGKLYSSRASWMACVDPSLRHPFTKQIISVGLRGNTRIESFFIPEVLFENGRMKRHPWAKRYFHIDQSTTTDRTGIACVHIAEWITDPNTLLTVPVVEVDFALAVQPPKAPDKLSIAKCRGFVFTLRSLGMKIGKVTYDQFQCLLVGSKVLSARGVLDNREVKVGDLVWSKSGWREVEKVFTYCNVPVRKIKTRGGYEISGTPGHMLEFSLNSLTTTGYCDGKRSSRREHEWGWKKLEDVVIGDIPNIPENIVEAGEYQRLTSMRVPYRGCLKGWAATPVLNEGLAEVLGYLWGDGVWHKDGLRFVSGGSDDTATILRIVGKYFNRKFYPDKKGNVNISSRFLVRWLEENGLRKSTRLPDKILKSPNSVIAAFLRGLYSADGSVSEKSGNEGQVSLSSHSRELLLDVKCVLVMKFGIKTSLSESRREYKGDLGLAPCFHLRCSGDRSLFGVIGFSSDKKQGKFDRWVKVKGRVVYDRVVSIEDSFGDVVDFKVKGDPSYAVNGFVSHNSSDSIQIIQTNRIDAGLRSVDRDDKAYLQVCDLIDEKRLRFYDYPVMRDEFFDLDHDAEKRKVDHPKTRENGEPGSKDVTDGLVGAVANALEDVSPSDFTSPGDTINSITVRVGSKHSYGEKIKDDWMISGYTNSKMKTPEELKGKKLKGKITGILGGDEQDVSFF